MKQEFLQRRQFVWQIFSYCESCFCKSCCLVLGEEKFYCASLKGASRHLSQIKFIASLTLGWDCRINFAVLLREAINILGAR